MSVLMIMSGSGLDFSPVSVSFLLYYFCLFRKLNLDKLSVFTNASRYSVFNVIEHLLSPLSIKLYGVVFLPKVEGKRT